MAKAASATTPDILRALGDPVRWNIIERMSLVDELARSGLEDTLPISKPTISYHMKVLVQAGLVEARKDGRSLYYVLRRDVLHELIDEMWSLVPAPRPVREGHVDHSPSWRRARTEESSVGASTASGEHEAELLTW